MTLADQIVKNTITKVIKSQDYRTEIVALLNAEFLQFAIDFFKKIVDAKLQNKNITVDWYKETFSNPNLPAKEIAIKGRLNEKTTYNLFNSSTREIVFDKNNVHYDLLYQNIQNLIEPETEFAQTLTIKFNGISAYLDVSESLIVINTLAVKRSELRGGLWNTAGKSIEKYLMLTLCKLYQVPESSYDKCNQIEINLAELSNKNGFRRFKLALEKLDIPHKEYKGDLDGDLPGVLDELFLECR